MSVIVAPNSTIQLLNVVGLDNRYLHTYYFSNVAEQTGYFDARIKKTFSAQSYSRNTGNYIKLQVEPASLESYFACSYMRFQNTSFGSKWFYAFVTSVDYVNNQTIGVTYEIDVIQTWLYSAGVSVPNCFVERQTPTATEDAMTVSHPNCEPEPFNVTNYHYRLMGNTDLYDVNGEKHKVVLITHSLMNYPTELYDAFNYCMFSGLSVTRKDCNNSDEGRAVRDTLKELTTSEDGTQETSTVVSVTMLPIKLAPSSFGMPEPNVPTLAYDFTEKWSNVPNGYACTYNKCLRYPYNYLHVTDHNGLNITLRREWFSGNVLKFNGRPSYHGTGEFIFYPLNYKGITDDYNDKIVINNFPQCAFTIDSYRAWIAHGGLATLQTNMENMRLQRETATDNALFGVLTGATRSGGSAAAGVAMGANPGTATLGAGMNILSGTAGFIQSTNEIKTSEQIAVNNYEVTLSNAQAMPDVVAGTTASNIMSQIQANNAYVYQVFPSFDEFKRLDKFFDVFGYTQDSVRAPIYNPTSSANGSHMFVKTKMANVSGSAPAVALAGINKILDSGITFWSSAVTAGRYTL
jgi:hypothetical protein